jgi:hypothetical protein
MVSVSTRSRFVFFPPGISDSERRLFLPHANPGQLLTYFIIPNLDVNFSICQRAERPVRHRAMPCPDAVKMLVKDCAALEDFMHESVRTLWTVYKGMTMSSMAAAFRLPCLFINNNIPW